MPSASTRSTVPQRLLAFLTRLGAELDRRGDAVALLGLGSVGRDLHRLDEHSDADFFVVVDDAEARDRYLADIDWLEAAHPLGPCRCAGGARDAEDSSATTALARARGW